MLCCTSSREPAMQVWPVAAKMPETTPFTAFSMCASSNTMLGDLPPSSMLTRFRPLRRGLVDQRAGAVGAGERHLGDQRVLDQRRADVGTEAGDDVDHAGREARLLDQLHEFEHRRRGEFRRLQHDRVAGGERGRELPRGEQQRRIPRRDGGDHAERLVARVVEACRACRWG